MYNISIGTYKYRNMRLYVYLCMACIVVHRLVWFCIWAQIGNFNANGQNRNVTTDILCAVCLHNSTFLMHGKKNNEPCNMSGSFLNHLVSGWFLLCFFSSSGDKMWCAEKKPSVLYRKIKDNWLEKPGTLPVLSLVHGDLAVWIRNEPTFLRFRGKWKGKLCRRQVIWWEQARNVISEKLLLPSHEMWAAARLWCCALRTDGKANSGKATVCCSINPSDNSNASDSWLFTIIYHWLKMQWKPPRAPSRNPLAINYQSLAISVLWQSRADVFNLNNTHITVLPRAQ